MHKWEYLFVTCRYQNDDWRPAYINGEEIIGKKSELSISEFSNLLGILGWEIVNLVTNQVQSNERYRLIFKRLRKEEINST